MSFFPATCRSYPFEGFYFKPGNKCFFVPINFQSKALRDAPESFPRGERQDLGQTGIILGPGHTLQFFECLGFVEPIFENGFKVCPDVLDVGLGISLAFQADLVDAAMIRR